MKIAAIILTKNEELHLERCLKSIKSIVDTVIIVDSGSTDKTIEIANSYGCLVSYNDWVNYSTQFNYGIQLVPIDCDWIMRIDADEFLVQPQVHLRESILESKCDGLFIKRSMRFLDTQIRWGGVFPIKVVRFFKRENGRCESRWMDEHIMVNGKVGEIDVEICDHNLNSIDWWIDKHLKYSLREAVDVLISRGLCAHEVNGKNAISDFDIGIFPGVKRFLKNRVYNKLPFSVGPLFYFIYRFIVRFGFLDGKQGIAFHFLHAFWYRLMVDIRIFQVKNYAKKYNVTHQQAILKVLGIKL